MRDRLRIDDPYAKPWVARDAAKNVVRNAAERGYNPSEMIDQHYGIYRDDYTAVVGRLVGTQPPREIAPDEVGVTGFAPEGEIFPLGEVWQEVTGEAMPEIQAPLAQSVKRRRRSRP